MLSLHVCKFSDGVHCCRFLKGCLRLETPAVTFPMVIQAFVQT